MKLLILASICLCAAAYVAAASQGPPKKAKKPPTRAGQLPTPRPVGPMSLEEAINTRRSARDFAPTPLTMEEISQLCWAAQGITDEGSGKRAAPSAGALYPIELYVVLPDGVFHYQPKTHSVELHTTGDMRAALRAAALDQEVISNAPACFVVAGIVDRTAKKYGVRAERYCYMEAGHVGQNILLQATSLGLVGVPVGAYEDRQCASVLKLPRDQRVLYLMPIGHAE